MSSGDPVTLWMEQLRNADRVAADGLWQHFNRQLFELARKKLPPRTRRVYDEEDAAQSAFQSVCAGIAAGRFPDLHDRASLWQLMLVVTARKVARRIRHDLQKRRDDRRNVAQSIFVLSADEAVLREGDLQSREPTPEFAFEFAETCEVLFQSLDDSALRQVVTLRMEGYTDAEIAGRLKCSRRTVQRRLEVIRRHWDRLELFGE